LHPIPVGVGAQADSGPLENVMPVMQRVVMVIAVNPDGTCTSIWSMFGTSAAVSTTPSAGKS
jgi:hypothetical protein